MFVLLDHYQILFCITLAQLECKETGSQNTYCQCHHEINNLHPLRWEVSYAGLLSYPHTHTKKKKREMLKH